MRMLNSLRDVLDDIDNEWEHDFVEGLIIELEEGRDFSKRSLSDKQFTILVRIYERYCA